MDTVKARSHQHRKDLSPTSTTKEIPCILDTAVVMLYQPEIRVIPFPLCVQVCAHICAKARGQPLGIFLRHYPLYFFLKQIYVSCMKLPLRLSWLVNISQGSTCLCLPRAGSTNTGYQPGFLLLPLLPTPSGSWGLNSGPRVCTASPSVPELSPQHSELVILCGDRLGFRARWLLGRDGLRWRGLACDL